MFFECQDIPENAADFAHLDHLHAPVIGSDVEKTNESSLNNMIKHGIKVCLLETRPCGRLW